MKIVVDTNIIFSGILSPNGVISDFLINSSGIFDFYSPSCLLEELDRYYPKLIKLAKLTKSDIDFLRKIILNKVSLIDVQSIQEDFWEQAIEFCKDVDQYDAPFIALSLGLNAPLWTGDKKLIKGLKNKNINWLWDTQQIRLIRDNTTFS